MSKTIKKSTRYQLIQLYCERSRGNLSLLCPLIEHRSQSYTKRHTLNSRQHIPNQLHDELSSDELGRLILRESATYQKLDRLDDEAAWQRFAKKNGASPKTLTLRPALKVAASLLLIACIGAAVYQYAGISDTKAIFASETEEIKLPDESLITLKGNSKIEYKKHFGESRDINLEGEAFFEVAKDGRPFHVHAGDVTVTVLGTAFNVDEKSDGDVYVSVLEGSVRVQKPDGTAEVLKAQDKLVYRQSSNEFELTQARENDWAWIDNALYFEQEPLSNVIADIAEFYEVEIVIKKKKMRTCPFTSTLPLQATDVQETLRLVAAPLGMKIQKQSDKKFVLSKGYCPE